jgi:hypothetical protein
MSLKKIDEIHTHHPRVLRLCAPAVSGFPLHMCVPFGTALMRRDSVLLSPATAGGG